MTETSAHVRRNREHWESRSAEYQDHNRTQLNRFDDELRWGVWDVPERTVGAFGDVTGLRALEYGCGASQSGIKLAKLGADVTGMDVSLSQLRAGLANMEEAGVRLPTVQADAERTPFRDASFDLVWCDHGAMSFADPYRTVPEVARLLRGGGLFLFSILSPFAWIAMGGGDAVSHRFEAPYFGMHSIEIDEPGWRTTEFQLPYGEWIRLFAANGFRVLDLIELRPEPDAVSTYVDASELSWSRDYPYDQIWKVRKDD
ncbi:MAG TPA: class I SAM-dependent methyltransferase [Actinomycetota bacterium]|nr:class I SAM-dependent methyltransferase [Actinomycetota bacterium]